MAKTFVGSRTDEMARTEYICGNPFSDLKLAAGDFSRLEEVWRQEWLDIGAVPPRAVTDRTVRSFREGDPDRVIAHYMQPHCPFVPHPELMAAKDPVQWGDQDTKDVWARLRDSELTEDTVWRGYREDLEYVLEVALLLNNVDADEVVITSDHGNAMGE